MREKHSSVRGDMGDELIPEEEDCGDGGSTTMRGGESGWLLSNILQTWSVAEGLRGISVDGLVESFRLHEKRRPPVGRGKSSI